MFCSMLLMGQVENWADWFSAPIMHCCYAAEIIAPILDLVKTQKMAGCAPQIFGSFFMGIPFAPSIGAKNRFDNLLLNLIPLFLTISEVR